MTRDWCISYGGVEQLIALARGTVLGVDVASGKLLWSHEHESTCDQNVTSPIYQDGQVFVTSAGPVPAPFFLEISDS